MSGISKKLMGTTAAAGGGPLAIEDVFSTYLYTGNGSTQTITNGIDLAGEGGLVWVKTRAVPDNHSLVDTERGGDFELNSNTTSGQGGGMGFSFNSDGFTLGSSTKNANTAPYASWTFRKAPRFFDVVTWTGTGSPRTIAHNLGVEPGCIIVKAVSGAALGGVSDWTVYHRGVDATNPEQYRLYLNTGGARVDQTNPWNDTSPTSTEFTVGTDSYLNANGDNYVAYLFAHDPLGPSGDGSDGLIACGSYTGNGSADGPEIDLGWEPQWVLLKNASAGSNWLMYDVMRGLTVGTSNAGPDQLLQPHTSNAEYTDFHLSPNATGFKVRDTGGDTNTSGQTFIYIAIRRGPMRAPTSGTEVYNTILRTGTSATASVTGVGFSPDLIISGARNANRTHGFFTRLHGAGKYQISTAETGEYSNTTTLTSFDMDGYSVGSDTGATAINTSDNLVSWNFKRTTNVYDTVVYTGTGSATTVSHNLGIAPELMIIKGRSTSFDRRWIVYTGTANKYMRLNTTDSLYTDGTVFNNTSPSATSFTVGTSGNTNASGETYIAHLFGTLSGISKVGSYTGNGTSQTIDCGFTSGARFVLIKKSSGTGDWWVFDTARGIVSGNDPALNLNTTSGEDSNYDMIDPDGSGFIVTTAGYDMNASGDTYIFLAIA